MKHLGGQTAGSTTTRTWPYDEFVLADIAAEAYARARREVFDVKPVPSGAALTSRQLRLLVELEAAEEELRGTREWHRNEYLSCSLAEADAAVREAERVAKSAAGEGTP